MIRTKQTKPADFADILSALGDATTEKPSKLAADDEDEERIADASADAQDIGPHPAIRLRRFLGSVAWGSVTWRWRFGRGGGGCAPAAAYAAEAAECEPAETIAASRPAEPAAATAKPPQTDDEAIAEELGLSAILAEVDLRQIRREFAKKNHPDRFGPAQRMRAAQRMSIANMLIDRHLKQRAQAQQRERPI
jgi:hypothetical protein